MAKNINRAGRGPDRDPKEGEAFGGNLPRDVIIHDEWNPGHPEVNHYGPNGDPVRNLLKIFRQIDAKSGYSMRDIFRDWMELTYYTMRELPRQFQSRWSTGEWDQTDPQDMQEVWARMRARYGDRKISHAAPYKPFSDPKATEIFNLFSKGMGELFIARERGYRDIMGDIFNELEMANESAGQVLTPFAIAKLMAEMTLVPTFAEQMWRRMRQAIKKGGHGPELIMGQIMHGLAPDDESWQDDSYPKDMSLIKTIMGAYPEDVLPHFEPITISDCACGTGVMFLGAASVLPDWVIHSGLVKFYGQDIDPKMVHAAQIQCDLFGLNSYWVKVYMPLFDPDFQAKMEEQRKRYEEREAKLKAELAARELEEKRRKVAESNPLLLLAEGDEALKHVHLDAPKPTTKPKQQGRQAGPHELKKKTPKGITKTFEVNKKTGEISVMPTLDLFGDD